MNMRVRLLPLMAPEAGANTMCGRATRAGISGVLLALAIPLAVVGESTTNKASAPCAERSALPPGDAPWWPSRYGADDQIGTLNEITPEVVRAATALVKTGRVVDLGRVLDEDTPKFSGRYWHQTVDVSPHVTNLRRRDAVGKGWGKNQINWITEIQAGTFQVGTQLDSIGRFEVNPLFTNLRANDPNQTEETAMDIMTTHSHLPEVVMPRCQTQHWLRGQTALVTGAGTGIGKEIALALAAYGADVAVNYVSGDDTARQVTEAILETGNRGIAIKADVSNEEQVQSMFKRLFEEFGTIDILVNNAGLQQDASFEELTLAQWNKVIGVNLTGQFLCARAAVREFKRRGVRPEVSCAAGKIICISSVHDVIPWAGHVNYAASKGGVMLMMKSIAQEVAPYRIRVNSICPGAVRTPINMQAWATPEAYDDLMRLIPYKRIGEPVEIGRVAAWLASDYADYVTGANLYVDGGMTLYPGFETGG